jgi:hypothetical protein
MSRLACIARSTSSFVCLPAISLSTSSSRLRVRASFNGDASTVSFSHNLPGRQLRRNEAQFNHRVSRSLLSSSIIIIGVCGR